jgi:hypothetical protein
MEPRVVDEVEAGRILRKQLGKFLPIASVHHQAYVDFPGSQEPEIIQRKERFATHSAGSIIRDEDDLFWCEHRKPESE